MITYLFYCDLGVQFKLDNIPNGSHQGASHAPPGPLCPPEVLDARGRNEEAPDHPESHFPDKLLLGEHREPRAEAGHRLGEVVVVHAAYEVCDEALPHVLVHTGEEEL